MKNAINRTSEFIERHKVAVNVVCWGSIPVMMFAPAIRREAFMYREMQRRVFTMSLEMEIMNDILANNLGMNDIVRGAST